MQTYSSQQPLANRLNLIAIENASWKQKTKEAKINTLIGIGRQFTPSSSFRTKKIRSQNVRHNKNVQKLGWTCHVAGEQTSVIVAVIKITSIQFIY